MEDTRFEGLGPQNLPYRLVKSSPLCWRLDKENFTPVPSLLGRLSTQGSEGIVFDLDGTLVNSEPALLRSVFITLESMFSDELGQQVKFSRDQITEIDRKCFRRNDPEMCSRLYECLRSYGLIEGRFASISKEEFIKLFRGERKKTFIQMCHSGNVQCMPGAIDFVARAYSEFGPMCINTGSPVELASAEIDYVVGRELRDKHGLEVDEVFPKRLRTYGDECGEQFGKPHPLCYVLAANRIGIVPSRLIAVMDRANDAEAALTAGYGKIIIVPEDLNIKAVLTKDKHAIRNFFRELPSGNPLRDTNRVIVTGNLAWIRFVNEE